MLAVVHISDLKLIQQLRAELEHPHHCRTSVMLCCVSGSKSPHMVS